MRRTFVVFDVASDVAHFRRPYSVTSALTFPIPPRTALCGLIGAIVGLPKNSGLAELRDEFAVFGVQVLRPLRIITSSFNLLHTKDSRDFRPKRETPHAPKRYETIQNPAYRIYFSHPHLGTTLHRFLSAGQSWYTPSLGLAWMVAWFPPSVRSIQGEWIGDGGRSDFVSPVRVADIRGEVTWHDEGVYQRIRMPAEMQPDRTVTRYEEYIIDTTGNRIAAVLSAFWRLDDETVFSPM